MSRPRSARLSFLSLAAISVSGILCASATGPLEAKAADAGKPAALKGAGLQTEGASRALPLVFEENAGQLPQGTVFAGRTSNYTVQVRPSELLFGLAGKKQTQQVTVGFTGSDTAKGVGVSDAGFRTNFYLGKNPRDWHTNVRNFDRVALRGLYPGIDAEFYSTSNEIEHDFMVAPGADAAKLAMHLAGAKTTTLSTTGDVVLTGEEGALKLHKPHAYQIAADGTRKVVDAEFVLAAHGSGADLTFKLGAYDHTRELVIDPVITYATYIAGDAGSTPTALTSDASGNVYLTGTTASTSATFGAAATTLIPSTLPDPPTAVGKVTFIARVSRSTGPGGSANVNGSQIAWLTYYGATSANPGDVVADAIALEPATFTPNGGAATAGSHLYIAGETTATAIPGATNGGAATLSPAGSSYGFFAEFNDADGTAADSTAYSTYVDGGNGGTQVAQTNLQAITVDATGSVTIGGNSTGDTYPTTAVVPTVDPTSALGVILATLTTPYTFTTTFCTSAGMSGTSSKGLLATFSNLTTRTYSTYVCGKTTPSASSFYTLTGVSVTATGNGSTTMPVYPSYAITGSTNLDFPMSGVYDLPTATTPPAEPAFFNPGSATATNAFAASLNPNTLTVNWSYWSDGAGVDQSNGLTIDTSTTPSSVVVFGSTTSDFATTSETSPASTATPGYMTSNTSSQQTGFAVSLNSGTGALGGISLLEAGGTSGASVTAAAADGNGNILLAGSQTGAKATFPAQTSGAAVTARPAGTPVLPPAQDVSQDPATTGKGDGFLVRMPNTLASVDYVSFFGPNSATGSSKAVGVTVDAVTADNSTLPGSTSSPLAFVLLNEMPGGSGSYTDSAAEEQVPQAGATNAAYLAQVGFVAPGATPSFTYTPANASYTPNPVGYSAQGESSLTLTWPVQVAAAGTSQLVFNLPQSQYLSAYTLPELSVTIGSGANVATADCALGVTNASANPASNPTAAAPIAGPGITCVIPQVPANTAGTTVTFQLSGVPVTSAVPGGAGTFPVAASAYDATGVGYDLTQMITTAGVPALTISVTANPALVSAATSPTQTDAAGDLVTVTYTYTISNTSAYDSPNTKLVTNLNTTTAGTTLLSNATGTSSVACDPTTAAAGCDVPAHGSLTYTVSGVYLDSNFSTSGTGPFTVTQGVPYVSFSTPMTNVGNIYPTSTTGPTVMVNGTTTVTANAITTNQPTYANHTSFQLGDQDVELTASFTNSGKDQAGSYTATVTLPQGYTATASNCAGAAAPYTSCTFTNIAPGATVSFTITGRFDDTGASSDAVAGPLTTGPSAVAVTGSQTSNSVSAQLSSVTSGTSNGTYIQTSTLPPATSIKVTRVNALTYAISAATPISSNTVNELGPLHATYPTPNDQLSYTATIKNTGTSVARGIYFIIPLPNAASGTVPVVTITNIAYSTGLSAANQLTCSYVTAQNGVVCYESDLTPGAALPTTTPHPTTTPQTYTITFSTSYDETAVPQNVKTVQVTQGNGTIYAAADTYNPGGGLGVSASVTSPAPAGAANTINIERLTSIVSNISVSAVGSAAATNYMDKTHVTLDSNSATSAPGVFDTILFQSSTSNMGPNDAAQLIISIPIPALTRVAVPQYCTLNGVTGPSATLLTVTAASTMTCATPAISTVASTATNQLRPAAAACPAAPAPSGGALSSVTFDPNSNCLSVAFYAKYSDAPSTTGTIVGANATGAATYLPASISETDVDTPSTPAAAATAAVTTIQRAAHLKLASPIAVPTYTTGAALTLDASGIPEVAQAALHMDPVTRAVTSGEVYNCLRYAISVTNEGPNYVLMPTVNYTESPTTFVPTRVSVGTAPLDASSVNCSVNTIPTSTIVPALAMGGTQMAYIDGYFDIGSLGANANSGTATFATQAFGNTGFIDSDTAGTASGDFAGTRSVTLVNTPYTDSNNTKFGITAYGTTPQATLIFTNVSSPGITSALAASTVNCTAPTYDANHPAPPANVNICFPYGKSPLPADNGLVRNLYQPGATPQYYQIPSTAVVPTSAVNSTSICFTMNGAAFPDIFVKPERVLLWLMANASAGTAYNTFPTGYSGFTSPLASQSGDVTTWVTPYIANATAPSYTTTPSSFTFPQIPQAQPNQVCGTVNGFATTATATASSASTAETFGVLEPVNFPPVVVAGSIAASSTVSKGSTSALLDIYVLRAVGTTLNTYDYDDRDPCYIASAAGGGSPRKQCDDNPYLYAVTFTGGNSNVAVASPLQVSALTPENVANAPMGSYHLLSNVNLSSSSNVFVSVADQGTGADAYNTDIATSYGGSNPFLHQGNFLSANYSLSSGGQPPLCDPGSSLVGGYATIVPTCAGGVGGTTSGTERYIRGGQKTASTVLNYGASQDLGGGYYALGSIGAQSVTASNLAGTGLIPLPYPGADPTTTDPPNAADPATAAVSGGQTAGFAWLWLSGATHAAVANGALPGDQYNLTCFQVDAATQNTPQPFSAGVSCSVTTSTVATASNPSPSATVYTFADSSGNNGSSYPTIYVTTSGGTLYGALGAPVWKRTAEGLALAMLFPVLFFRKRLGRGAGLAVILLMLAAAPLLSGCGTGGPASGSTGPVTPSGKLYFRVMATPLSTAGGEKPITSAPFVVSVQ